MTIRHIRLDSRLIHGQVASFWSNFLKINRIVVVSNDVVKDKMNVEMLKMACPVGVKLSVLQPNTTLKNFEDNKYGDDVILVITDTVETLHELMLLDGITKYIKEINVGNLSTSDGKIAIKKSVYFNKEEFRLMNELKNLDIKIDARMIPNDDSINFIELLNSKIQED